MVHNKGNVAVLHNRNKMVKYLYQHGVGVRFRWCHHLAQRCVLCWYDGLPSITCSDQSGFPQWRAKKSFYQLPAQEQAFQKEETYARATVALTQAQEICFIMALLDMQGLVGAATIGCLKCRTCFSGLYEQKDSVFLIRLKDDDLLESPDDSTFLQRFSCARVNGVYRPLVLVEAYITEEDSASKMRRLHLIVVDLHRRRRMADRVLRLP